MTTTETERTLAAMSASSEAARQANHAAYHAPRTTTSVYDRTGMLHDLLCKVEQLARVLSEQTESLPPEALYSTDETPAGQHVFTAAEHLMAASGALTRAASHVNDAWSELSPVGTRE